ncbi:MAG: cysteine synthase A [Spirochaetales bacterium]|nr:cysteine synthase A [Spirochaetales bacterium]MCF7938136.1 cysteine synthase A [Spirochaetales bacterium]
MNLFREQDISNFIGRTPLVPLRSLSQGLPGMVAAKMESMNPLSSVKDRIGRSMIEDAEQRGLLQPGGTIVEATSGNTGLALAFIGAARGYRVILVMPDTMSIERRRMLSALGAELELTPGSGGMNSALERAGRILGEVEGAWQPGQFGNPANPKAHREGTAEEILTDSAEAGETIGAFVAGVGTGGTITGVGERLKENDSGVRVVAVEPDASPVLSGGEPGPHGIQGIGAGFVPDVLNRSVIDEIFRVSLEDARDMSNRLAREEGILAGFSAGANVRAALQTASRKDFEGKLVVTVICDTGERYLSTTLYQEDV